MSFSAKVLVFLKDGVLDTQGKAVEKSLHHLGYEGLQEVRVGRYIQLIVEAADREEALRKVDGMCRDLLVNAIIEDYSAEVEES
jgi:phosphoribosylformylglycinamidine synthase PurS subunit